MNINNEAKSKISSIEPLLTEAHLRAKKSNNKLIMESGIKFLEEATDFINNFED